MWEHKVESPAGQRLANSVALDQYVYLGFRRARISVPLQRNRIQLVETRLRLTGACEKLQDSLTAMQEDLSSTGFRAVTARHSPRVQRQLLAGLQTFGDCDMGESLDTLVNRDQPASPSVAEDRVANSVSSRAGARGLSPLLEKDEEDEDWVSKGLPDLGQEN